MPIRPELRPLYPPHWRELSSRVRFERAEGRCQRCGRPHLVLLRCLPDGRWFDEQAATWRDRRGRPARWPDLMEAPRFRMTRVVLAAAHLDSDPTNNRLKNSARALPTLPHAARSAAPFGPALDHLPPAAGSRRSLPRPVPVIDRRADIETDVARVAIRGRLANEACKPSFRRQPCVPEHGVKRRRKLGFGAATLATVQSENLARQDRKRDHHTICLKSYAAPISGSTRAKRATRWPVPSTSAGRRGPRPQL